MHAEVPDFKYVEAGMNCDACCGSQRVALVVSNLLLIVMLSALASDRARDIAPRRRMTTQLARNPRVPMQS